MMVVMPLCAHCDHDPHDGRDVDPYGAHCGHDQYDGRDVDPYGARCDHDQHDGRDVDPYGLHVHLSFHARVLTYLCRHNHGDYGTNICCHYSF